MHASYGGRIDLNSVLQDFLTHANNTTKKKLTNNNSNTIYKSMQGKQKVCIHANTKNLTKKRLLHSLTANADQVKQNRTTHSHATGIIQMTCPRQRHYRQAANTCGITGAKRVCSKAQTVNFDLPTASQTLEIQQPHLKP